MNIMDEMDLQLENLILIKQDYLELLHLCEDADVENLRQTLRRKMKVIEAREKQLQFMRNHWIELERESIERIGAEH